MSETASGLIRVVVLILATTTFAAAWSGDRLTQEQFVVARREAGQQRLQLLASAETIGDGVAADPNSVAEPIAPTLAQAPVPNPSPVAPITSSYRARVEVEMELPTGIDPGRYQVVDQSGEVRTIRIGGESNQLKRRDIYILDQADGARRFFIRIADADQTIDAARTAEAPAARIR